MTTGRGRHIRIIPYRGTWVVGGSPPLILFPWVPIGFLRRNGTSPTEVRRCRIFGIVMPFSRHRDGGIRPVRSQAVAGAAGEGSEQSELNPRPPGAHRGAPQQKGHPYGWPFHIHRDGAGGPLGGRRPRALRLPEEWSTSSRGQAGASGHEGWSAPGRTGARRAGSSPLICLRFDPCAVGVATDVGTGRLLTPA